MLPFLPQKACMGRRCCQQRGLLRAFGEKGTHTARFLPDGPQVRRNARKGCEVYGAARWVTPLGRATRQVAAPTGWAGGRDGAKTRRWWVRGRHDAGGNGGVGTRRWRDRRRSQAGTSSPRREPGSAGGHGGTGATLADARRGAGGGAGAHGATGAMEAGDSWPREVGAHSAQYASAGGCYSPKLASIAATRSSSAPMSCWFTSSIFCKSAGEAFST